MKTKRDAGALALVAGELGGVRVDANDNRVWGKELSRFGRAGSHQIGGLASPHGIAIDSNGNVYVGESLDGRRVQRFKPVPGGTALTDRRPR